MKIREITLHNFRSVKDLSCYVADYGLFIGANNCGKSTILDALRMFYNEIKFEVERDAPKFPTADQETWVELEFQITENEVNSLKAEYLQKGSTFRVRRVFHSPDKTQIHLFGYENGKLSQNQFYGEDNVGQGKLGDIIYIPAVSRLEDVGKFSGPSPLRELVNSIFKKLLKDSKAFSNFHAASRLFGTDIQTEKTADSRSLKGLEEEINKGLGDWEARFTFKIKPLTEADIVKSMLEFDIFDETLKTNQGASSYGQGFQRQLIYRLFEVSAAYAGPSAKAKKKDFAPEFTLLLFEEPEAFLHPPQQSQLDRDLRKISEQDGRQVLISTHSPQFVSHAADNIPAIIRLHRHSGECLAGQVRPEKLNSLFLQNQDINNLAKGIKTYEAGPEDLLSDMEAVKYFLWLNPERCGAFFARQTLIVEGPTELVFINYLIQTGQIKVPTGGLFVLDAIGKFNIHRFMNLLGELKIRHSVLFDKDQKLTGDDKTFHDRVNKLIIDTKNVFTQKTDAFPDDMEGFLQYPLPDKPHRKPARLLLALKKGSIAQDRIDAFCRLVESLLV